jgi:hypothetical protein
MNFPKVLACQSKADGCAFVKKREDLEGHFWWEVVEYWLAV